MHQYADIKNLFLFFCITLSFGVGHKALGGNSHRCIEKSQHGYRTSSYIEDAKV